MKPIIFADDEYYFHTKLTQGFKDRLPEVPIEATWDGKELVEKVLAGDYGVIVTDFNMGNFGPNGIEAAQTIRNKGIKTPIFMYSTREMPLEVLSGNPLDRAFQKEYDFEKLLEQVVRLYHQK